MMTTRRSFTRVLPVICGLLVAGCASSGTLSGDDPATWRCEAKTPLPSGSAVLWVRASAEYAALTRQIYSNATAALRRLARKERRGAWFVIMDADETLIDNSLYMAERRKCGLEFSAETWSQWVDEALAEAVPGGGAFVKAVYDAGGYVAIVTNRSDTKREATMAALEKNNIPVEALFLHADGTPGDKSPRWREAGNAIAATVGGKAPHPIMWVGDQISDLPRLGPDGTILGPLDQSLRDAEASAFVLFGERFIVLPNPLYGAWDKE